MPRFCANISLMFTEVPMLDRPAAARRAGFTGVEILSPFDFPAEDWARACRAAGVTVANFNAPIGDRDKGELGLAGLPGRTDEFRASIALALRYAEAMGAERVTVHAGTVPAGARREDCLAVLPENLAWAADRFGEAGVVCMTEALNSTDRPGALLHRTRDALDAVRRAGHPNLKIEADIYHMAVMGEDIPAILRDERADIAHVQFADVPGRNEPGTGAVDFPGIFRTLDAIGFDGWASAEYVPRGRTEDGLGWYAPWRMA